MNKKKINEIFKTLENKYTRNEIIELKYKNNDSVAEIATQLNMEEEQVLEALNEMIAVV